MIATYFHYLQKVVFCFFYFQFTRFLAEGNVVKTLIVEIACVSVNLVVMETHTQIV